ncbi:MAG: hypothetical protein SF053_04000 [Bacteroidia bacterium]|nr:hypothetical protein [Bacteroidia bacterium]
MKFCFGLIGLMLLAGACVPPSSSPSAKLADARELAGYWIHQGWADSLLASGSPLLAHDVVEELSMLLISGQAGDTIPVGYGFHEGGEFVLTALPSGWALTLPDNPEPVHRLELRNGKLMVDSVVFIKLPSTAEDIYTWALDTLIGGTYDMGGKTVGILPDGRITGMDSIGYAEVQLDFEAEDRYADHIRLSPDTLQRGTWYAYKVQQDTLWLYTLRCEYEPEPGEDCYQHVPDKVWKKLVRISR